MKICKILTCCLPLLCLLQASAQQVVPAPPNTAGLVNQTNIPVNLATGTANVQLPLASLPHTNGYELPVFLSYNTRGIKVQDIAGPVGLGWTLNAGGAITRVVMGSPDEDQNFLIPNSNSDYQDIAEGDKDGERDVFYFSWPGRSGRFVGDCGDANGGYTTCQYYSMPYQNIKIERTGLLTGSSTWKITDEYGTIYHFNKRETLVVNEMDHTGAYDVANEKEYVSTWYLTKIDFLDSPHDITLSYITGDQYDYEYYNRRCETAYEGQYNGDDIWSTDCTDANTMMTIPSPKYISEITSAKGKVVFDWYEGEYVTMGDNGNFWQEWQPAREDVGDRLLRGVSLLDINNIVIENIDLEQSEMSSETVGGMEDLAGGQTYTSTSPDLENKRRLVLDQVKRNGSLFRKFTYSRGLSYIVFDSPELGKDKFINPDILPSRNSSMFDHYGYSNGENHNFALDPLIGNPVEITHPAIYNTPSSQDNQQTWDQYTFVDMPKIHLGEKIGFLTRQPFEPYTKAGSLHQIIYPSGGIEEIHYAIPEPDSYGDEPGGLIVTEIVRKFNDDSEFIANHTELSKAFEYEGVNLRTRPKYNSVYRQKNGNVKVLSNSTLSAGVSVELVWNGTEFVTVNGEDLSTTAYNNTNNSGLMAVTNAVSFSNLFDLNGVIADFDKVTVTDFDGTQSVHEFYNSGLSAHDDIRATIEYQGFSSIVFDITKHDFIPFPPRTTRFWKRGMPSSSEQFTESESMKTGFYYHFDETPITSLVNNKVYFTLRYENLNYVSKLYNRIFGTLTGTIIPDRDDLIVVGTYYNDIVPIFADKTITETFIIGQNDPAATTQIEYSHHATYPGILTGSVTTYPDGTLLTNITRYPDDFNYQGISTGPEWPGVERLQNEHAIAVPLETSSVLTEGATDYLVDATLRTFEDLGTAGVYPDKTYKLFDKTSLSSLGVNFIHTGVLDLGDYELVQDRSYSSSTGLLTSETDRFGVQTSYTYDATGNVTKETINTGIGQFETHFTHQNLVGLTSIADENGSQIKYEYDQHNRQYLTRDENDNILERIRYNRYLDEFTGSISVSGVLEAGNSLAFECIGCEALFGDLEYEWDFGDGTTSTQISPNHSFSSDGDYNVSLTLTSSEYEENIVLTENLSIEIETLEASICGPGSYKVCNQEIGGACVTGGTGDLIYSFSSYPSDPGNIDWEYKIVSIDQFGYQQDTGWLSGNSNTNAAGDELTLTTSGTGYTGYSTGYISVRATAPDVIISDKSTTLLYFCQ